MNKFLKSLPIAFSGIVAAFKSELSLKIQLVFAVVAIFCGFYLNITRMEWLVLVLTISLVIAAEMLNTAIEKTLDLLHPQQSPKVKFIKDVAAGAVLILALASVVVGILIFWGYI